MSTKNRSGVKWQLEHKADNITVIKKKNFVTRVRDRTTLTERPPLAGEVSAKFCGRSQVRFPLTEMSTKNRSGVKWQSIRLITSPS
jgi:hypothetical protein